MAVRGLGCPARFHLTAGQRGDAPQALTLIEGMPAEVVMADTAYDSEQIRKAHRREGRPGGDPQQPVARPEAPAR